MGKMNLAVNQLLQRKEIYADLINGTVFDGQQKLTKDDLEWIPEETGIFYRDEKGRLCAVERRGDIRMRAENETFSLILATETENKVHYAMPVKNMLYDALEYTKQVQNMEKVHRENNDLGTSDEFLSGISKNDKLIPVITTVFYVKGSEEWDGPKSLWDMFHIPDSEDGKQLREYLPDYRIHFIDANDINNPELFKTALKPIFFMLRYRKEKEKLQQYIQDNQNEIQKMDDVEKMAAYMLLGEQKRVEQLLAESGAENEKSEEVPDMCEAITEMIQDGEIRGEKRGMRKGLRRGMKKGEKRGKKMGIKAARIASVQSLMENLSFTPSQAMDALNIPDEARADIFKQCGIH